MCDTHLLVVSSTGATRHYGTLRPDFPRFRAYRVKNATVYDPTGSLLPGTIYLCSDTLAGLSRHVTSVSMSSSGMSIIATLNYVPGTGGSYFVCSDDDDGHWMTMNDVELLRALDLYVVDRDLASPAYISPMTHLSVNVTIAFKL